MVLVIFVFLFNSFSYGASFSISGVSADSDVKDNSIKIYVGWANPGSACTSSTETCDTCSGTTRKACNQKSIHSNLYLNIEVSSKATGISGLGVKAFGSDGTTAIAGVTANTASSAGYTFNIKWTQLCAAVFGASCESVTTQGPQAAKSFKFGPAKADGSLAETITVEVYLNVFTSATTSYTYTPCTVNADKSITDPNSGVTDGACALKLFPGDKKVFVDEFGSDWGGATPAIGSMPVDSVIFFNKAFATSNEATLDSMTLNDIANAIQVKVTDDASDPLEDYTLTGLNNDTKYCFVMATMDRSGTIQKFTPAAASLSEAQQSGLCATPSEVAGVLKDKNCFIATAAFGSRMNPHVQRFRDFRNMFLSQNNLGKKFIHFYYQQGPQAAAWIQHSDFLKAATRFFLWPLFVFVEISLHFGIWAAVMSFIFVLVIFQFALLRVVRRSKFGFLFKKRYRGTP